MKWNGNLIITVQLCLRLTEAACADHKDQTIGRTIASFINQSPLLLNRLSFLFFFSSSHILHLAYTYFFSRPTSSRVFQCGNGPIWSQTWGRWMSIHLGVADARSSRCIDHVSFCRVSCFFFFSPISKICLGSFSSFAQPPHDAHIYWLTLSYGSYLLSQNAA